MGTRRGICPNVAIDPETKRRTDFLKGVGRNTAGFTSSEWTYDIDPSVSLRIFYSGGGWRIFAHEADPTSQSGYAPAGVCIGFTDTKPQALTWIAAQFATQIDAAIV